MPNPDSTFPRPSHLSLSSPIQSTTRRAWDEEKNRRKSLDPDDRPKINDTTPPDATPVRQSSFKLGLKSKPSFSWRRNKSSRPGQQLVQHLGKPRARRGESADSAACTQCGRPLLV